ncbi:MAG: hypothetical protein WBD87_11255 [Candidatus Acidiferrales bacterium]
MNQDKLVDSLNHIIELAGCCLEEVGHNRAESLSSSSVETKVQRRGSRDAQAVDFGLPFRPFINRYISANTSGPIKFTFVLAHLARGRTEQSVELRDIEKGWRSKKGRLGNFNLAYPTRAKDKGWIDSPKKGTYALRPEWTEILHEDE